MLTRLSVKPIASGQSDGISQNRTAYGETRTQTGTRAGKFSLLGLKTRVYNGVSMTLSHIGSKRLTNAVLNDPRSRRASVRPARFPA
jgi:hypothetical protein